MAAARDRSYALVFLLAFAVTSVGALAQQGLPGANTAARKSPCATPRQAVAAWSRHLRPESYDLHLAARCAQRPATMSQEAFTQAMRQLRQVFDWRGMALQLEKIPDTPGYVNPKTGREQVVLNDLLPQVWVEKVGARWVFPATVVSKIPTLHQKTVRVDLRGWVWLLPEWAKQDMLGIEGVTLWQLGALLLLVLLGMLLRLTVTSVVISRIEKFLNHFSGLRWGRDLLGPAAMPLGNLAMAAFLAFCIPSLALNARLAQSVMIAVRVLAAVSAVMMLYRSVDLLTAWIAARLTKSGSTGFDEQLVPLISRGLKVIIVLLGTIFVLQNLNVDVTSLLAGVTVGGLAVSFAARDTVSNLFGSVTVLIDKPFSVGDWVRTAGTEGIVETIGFRSTRIRTFYNSLVTVPNNKFTQVVVDNLGLREYRRCYITLHLRLDTTPEQIEAFCNGIRALLKAHPKTRKDYYEIHFNDYGSSSLDIMLYFFMKVPSWSDELRTRHEIFLDILRLAKSLGVQLAFPTQTLHVEQMATPSGEPRQSPAPRPQDLKRTVQEFGPGGAAVQPPGPRLGEGYFAE
ncbi:MAG: mechanosensitive ion channel family protein [Myxococcota bacterium]